MGKAHWNAGAKGTMNRRPFVHASTDVSDLMVVSRVIFCAHALLDASSHLYKRVGPSVRRCLIFSNMEKRPKMNEKLNKSMKNSEEASIGCRSHLFISFVYKQINFGHSLSSRQTKSLEGRYFVVADGIVIAADGIVIAADRIVIVAGGVEHSFISEEHLFISGEHSFTRGDPRQQRRDVEKGRLSLKAFAERVGVAPYLVSSSRRRRSQGRRRGETTPRIRRNAIRTSCRSGEKKKK